MANKKTHHGFGKKKSAGASFMSDWAAKLIKINSQKWPTVNNTAAGVNQDPYGYDPAIRVNTNAANFPVQIRSGVEAGNTLRDIAANPGLVRSNIVIGFNSTGPMAFPQHYFARKLDMESGNITFKKELHWTQMGYMALNTPEIKPEAILTQEQFEKDFGGYTKYGMEWDGRSTFNGYHTQAYKFDKNIVDYERVSNPDIPLDVRIVGGAFRGVAAMADPIYFLPYLKVVKLGGKAAGFVFGGTRTYEWLNKFVQTSRVGKGLAQVGTGMAVGAQITAAQKIAYNRDTSVTVAMLAGAFGAMTTLPKTLSALNMKSTPAAATNIGKSFGQIFSKPASKTVALKPDNLTIITFAKNKQLGLPSLPVNKALTRQGNLWAGASTRLINKTVDGRISFVKASQTLKQISKIKNPTLRKKSMEQADLLAVKPLLNQTQMVKYFNQHPNRLLAKHFTAKSLQTSLNLVKRYAIRKSTAAILGEIARHSAPKPPPQQAPPLTPQQKNMQQYGQQNIGISTFFNNVFSL